MSKKRKLIIISIVIGLVIAGGLFYYEGFVNNPLLQRAYEEDIVIDIPNREAKFIVRGWTYLINGDTEFYYRQSSKLTDISPHDISYGIEPYNLIKSGLAEISFYDDRVVITSHNPGLVYGDDPSEKIVCYYP